MKNYRNLNGCVSRMHRLLYEAYDKGYAQAKKDCGRPVSKWKRETLGIKGIWYRCENCKRYAIADYLFCPHCGADMRGDDHD